MEFPKNDGVAPVSKPKNTFLNKPKYWMIASKLAKNPAIRFTFNNLSQDSPLIKRAIKIVKIKKNNKFKVPPALAGEPKKLNLRSCENMVDRIKKAK